MKSLEAGAAIGAGKAKDDFGSIETRGIDMIPDVERKSKPFELLTVFFGPQFGYGNMLFGALATRCLITSLRAGFAPSARRPLATA